MTRRRRRVPAAVVWIVLVAAIGAVAAWRWQAQRAQPLPESGWPAVIAVLAGEGVAGVRDGSADRARFSDPFGVAVARDGSIYVADGGDAQRIRRIAVDGSVSTFAGGEPGYAEGRGASARFSTPSGLAFDSDGVLYVADTGNNAIRRITPDGAVSTLAGGGLPGFADGDGVNARFNGPVGVAVDPSGRVIVADTYNDRIRAIAPDGRVTTVAGSGRRGALDGDAHEAEFDTPCGVAVDAAGNIYVADTGNGAVRIISPSGLVTTRMTSFVGLVRPTGIASTASGVVYVTDDRGLVIELTPEGGMRTVGTRRPGREGGVDLEFRELAGLALAGPARLIVTDPVSAIVAVVESPSARPLRPPLPPGLRPRFNVEAFARQPLLWPFHPLAGPYEITGTLGEPRGDTADRFHAGLDVQAPQGTFVRAVRDGVVSNPLAAKSFNTLNESIRIGPIVYVHLRVGRERRGAVLDPSRFVPTYDDTGRMVDMRVKRGARFHTGDRIGTVNAFYHSHVNVGWPDEEYNPLAFTLTRFEDTIAPTIRRGGVQLFGEDGERLDERRHGRLLVDGRLRVVVDAWDQVNGNAARRRLGLYRLGYQVLNEDGSPAPGFGDRPLETIRFDRLTPDADPRAIFASGSGIPFYSGGSTRFLYVVTSTLQDGVTSPGVWDTSTLPPGDYTLRILAADINGNEAIANRDVAITVGSGPESL